MTNCPNCGAPITGYICNRKKCENGACGVCHNTTDINYAERDEKGEPIVSYYTEWKRLKWEV